MRLVLIAALTALVLTPAEAAPRVGALEEARRLVRAGDDEAAVAALTPAVGKLSGADGRAARYLLGRLLTERGDARGLAHLEALPAPFEDFDELRLLWLARAQVLAGRGGEALATIERFLKVAPKAPGTTAEEAPELRLERARLLRAAGQDEAALAALAEVIDGGPRWARARALRTRAEFLRASDPARADEVERRLLVAYPSEKATLAPGLRATEGSLTVDEKMTRARNMMARWDYERARVLFRGLVDHPRYGEEARWSVGVIGLEKLRDAAEEPREMFRGLAERAGKHREGALYRLMRTYIKEDRYAEALEVADRYDRLYPKGEHREAVAYYRAWLPFDERRCEAAMDAYIRAFGNRRSLVRGFKAWCFIRAEDWRGAVAAFEELVPYGNPLVRGKAWYWQAYALDKLGRRGEAKEKLAKLQRDYPLTWYAMLGLQLEAKWAGRDPRASKLPWPKGGGRPAVRSALTASGWTAPKLAGATAERFARVRRLVELGEVDRARELYRGVRAAVERAVPKAEREAFILFMGAQVEDFKHGWQTVSNGQLAAMTDMPRAGDVRWLLGYPEAYAPLVERLGARFGVYPRFVYAVMRQESRYNPAAISHTDAVGALQMIPPTAERVALELGTAYDERTFWRPPVGFPFSFKYLANHLALWRGNLVLTAASYNAGPAPVARWLAENPGQPLAFVVEEISYSEARNYSRKVAEHLLRYLYLYEPDAKVRGQVLDALFPVALNVPVPADPGY